MRCTQDHTIFYKQIVHFLIHFSFPCFHRKVHKKQTRLSCAEQIIHFYCQWQCHKRNIVHVSNNKKVFNIKQKFPSFVLNVLTYTCRITKCLHIYSNYIVNLESHSHLEPHTLHFLKNRYINKIFVKKYNCELYK